MKFSLFLLTFFMTFSADGQTVPVPPATQMEKVFKLVEQMPRFPGCEEMSGTPKEKENCAKRKMLEYIFTNLKYPEEAVKKGIEGTAVVKFVVAEDGSIVNAKILRDLAMGCGESALKVVEDMNNLPQKWTPGRQNGENVKVQYTLPIRFTLPN